MLHLQSIVGSSFTKDFGSSKWIILSGIENSKEKIRQFQNLNSDVIYLTTFSHYYSHWILSSSIVYPTLAILFVWIFPYHPLRICPVVLFAIQKDLVILSATLIHCWVKIICPIFLFAIRINLVTSSVTFIHCWVGRWM